MFKRKEATRSITCRWIVSFANISEKLAEFQRYVHIKWSDAPCVGQSRIKGHLWFICKHK